MAEPFLQPGTPVDTSNCEREPIHIPGAIQPHGYLFVVRDHRQELLQASENAAELTGAPVQEILGRPLGEVLKLSTPDRFGAWLGSMGERSEAPYVLDLTVSGRPHRVLAIAHRVSAGILVELLPGHDAHDPYDDITPVLQGAIERLQEAEGVEELCRTATSEIRKLTGFDRVMIYQFDEEWNGAVLAEDRAEHMDSYLGLHFPASDIPAQARKLYSVNRIRLIADVGYRPSPIIPPLNPLTNEPLDLSGSLLRSVSPIHIEYLKNMEVGASMSISLMQEDRLWGLVACHHAEPLFVPHAVLTACQLLGQVFSMLLAVKREQEEKVHVVQLREIQSRLFEAMVRAQNLSEGLIEHGPGMLDLLKATGAVLYREGQVVRAGETPDDAAVARLAGWLEQNVEGDFFYTDALASVYPEGETIRDVASGVLTFSLSRFQRYYAMWFRPEVPRTVYWAGNPNKPVFSGDGGTPRLHPRISFAAWKEELRGRARPWRPREIETARMLRDAIIDVVLVKADELARLNTSLEEANRALGDVNERLRQEIAERKEAENQLALRNVEIVLRNRELQHFAFVGSHDLQEPLRKIGSFADLLWHEYAESLDEQAQHYLDRMRNAAARMSTLISDLIAYSRVPTGSAPFTRLDLNEVVARAAGTLRNTMEAVGGRVEAGDLPVIEAEPDYMRRLFENLISNALKFRSERPPVVRVYAVEPPDRGPGDARDGVVRLMVEDNGIGFDEKYLDRIFSPFQRLQGGTDQVGTGIGLAICRRIVEHHNGTISAHSTPGQGSTFVIELPVSQPPSASGQDAAAQEAR